MNKADKDKVIAALEKAGAAKLADGTYLDKDCSITIALSIMRGLAEDAEPVAQGGYSWINCAFNGPAPDGYTSWQDFALSGEFNGVCVRAAKPEDYLPSPQAAQTALESKPL